MGDYRAALERLALKVTHVGHSASFVQAWVERGCGIAASWEPTEGIAKHRLRIPSPGSLDRLARICNREAWIAYHDLRDELKRAQVDLKAMKPPPRGCLAGFSRRRVAGRRNRDQTASGVCRREGG